MDTFGSCCLALQFGSRRFEWKFLLANVSTLILGSDFLLHNHLLVDVSGSRLLDSSTLEPIPAVSTNSVNSKSGLYAALLSTPEEFRDLLSKYPDVVSFKGFSPQIQGIQSATPSPHRLARQFLPKPAVLMQKSWRLPRESLHVVQPTVLRSTAKPLIKLFSF